MAKCMFVDKCFECKKFIGFIDKLIDDKSNSCDNCPIDDTTIQIEQAKTNSTIIAIEQTT